MELTDRIYNISTPSEDKREEFERDRDRILYSSAFRRLSGITQVVRAGEADVFHDRLTHTLKVAQVGRRLAQKLVREQEDVCQKFGVDAEVIEAACLAHDLGHPPFGHAGEEVLNELVSEHNSDGFEGNAQSFRVLTKLAVRYEEVEGLNLTRATLAASLKYPWHKGVPEVPKSNKKWGAYKTEADELNFALEATGGKKSVSAALMDWADDIAYSVHDIEDLYRCGMVPLNYLFSDRGRKKIVESVQDGWKTNAPDNAYGLITKAYDRLKELFTQFAPSLLLEPYNSQRQQRQELRFLTSRLIGRYIGAARLDEGSEKVKIADEFAIEVRLLKRINWDYIIANPNLAAQQHGQRIILTQLFEVFRDGFQGHEPPNFFPRKFKYLCDIARDEEYVCDKSRVARIVSDCICSMTEAETRALHKRLFGLTTGSVLDPIVR